MQLDAALDAYLHHLRIERGLAANSVQSYAHDLNKFIQYAASQDSSDSRNIDLSQVSGWLTSLSKSGLTSRSIARHLSALRGLLKFLIREGELAEDPAQLAARPKPIKRLPKPLDLAEIMRLLDAPNPDSALGVRDRAMLSMAYASGLRASEVVHIRVGDVDAQRGVVSVTGKGDKTRLVPLGEVALAHLDEYLKTSAVPRSDPCVSLLFPSRRSGGPLTRQAFWKIVKRHALKAGLSDRIHPHQLRHSFATHLLQGGADLRSVQTLLGHANVATTEIYTKVSDDQVRVAHRRSHPRG